MDSAGERIHSVDTMKGIAVAALVFLHCAVYYYGNLDSVDIENPPLLIAVIGVVVLWGGLFALMSGWVNTYRYEQRRLFASPDSGKMPTARRHGVPHSTKRLLLVGVGIVLIHLVYNTLGSPTALDFHTFNHQYSLIPHLLRNGEVVLSPRRLVQGTALQMIGVNLMGLALLLPLLARARRAVLICVVAACAFMATGLLRLALFPVYQGLLDGGRYVGAFFLAPFASEPYPVLPYFSFALMGAAMGFAMARRGSLSWPFAVVGAGLVGLGAVGLAVFPTNLHEPGLFWFAKVFFELGTFTLIAWALIAVAGAGRRRWHIFQRTARMSITVFILQTPLSEAFAAALTALIPGWNATLGVTLLFALANTALWMGIVALWSRAGYRFTVEHLWVTLFPGSTKLQGVAGAQRTSRARSAVGV